MDLHPVSLARAYVGLTQKELGTRIGRTQSFIARLERGDYEVAPLIPELRVATGLPEAFFSEDKVWSEPESAVSYRKRSACPAAIRNRAEFYATVAHGCLEPMIASYLRYREPNVPVIPMEEPPTDKIAARKAGAAAARRIREEWGVGWGPITDVIRLMESNGVRFFYVREPAESLDGFACWIKKKPFIFVNSYVADPARTRYDAAHELGHIVMHRELELDSDIDMCESMAHGFAAEFLAPWATFGEEAPITPDLDKLGRLRRRWRMSMQAMVKHMHANGAISDSSYTSAFKKFSFLGYRRGPEPGWLTPDASVMHSTFLDVLKSKGISPSALAESAGVPDSLLGAMVPEASMVYS